MSSKEHKAAAKKSINIGIIAVSTTRTLAEDKSGKWINKSAKKEGHRVLFHRVVPDHAPIISETILEVIRENTPHAVILTGGTGIGPKDVTIEAVRPLFRKELTAFGILFAMLSYEEIDSAAILSRATSGIVENTILFCIPGSLKACKLACRELIYPELGHIVKHIQES
jgi:molybdenum cofactor biosynthesis protein B